VYLEEQEVVDSWSIVASLKATVAIDPEVTIDANRSFRVYRTFPGEPIGKAMEDIDISLDGDRFVFAIDQPGLYYVINKRN